MKPYIASLFAGILAGVVYALIGVQSPAPPAIALVGLLGILAGEQILPVVRRMFDGIRLGTAWREAKCSQHMFGALPGARADAAAKRRESTPT
ncbi:XapX domain-containing protein [Burkholderia lata]|uniref:XapX domain-containing protein n=1 Tax=Burkholderia lata (strain ATCC 17760 / DSM 23089 / LMG 22485 / NCIMB 9086 / R18194 / 383) TaxID=482957 RepID=UPI001452E139|nr:XapX domain-containing protein [Burkholderia lata]VWC71544.1 XapX domain-containing protein [Burkholderia lata]